MMTIENFGNAKQKNRFAGKFGVGRRACAVFLICSSTAFAQGAQPDAHTAYESGEYIYEVQKRTESQGTAAINSSNSVERKTPKLAKTQDRLPTQP